MFHVKHSPRDFGLMVFGQVISILGSALLRFALSLYVLDLTGSEAAFAALFAVSNLPMLLAPVGGAVADRFNRRNLMVVFDFSSSAVVLCLFWLLPAAGNPVPLIGGAMVLLSVITAMYTPAVTASVPLLVPEERLAGANGTVQAVQALSGVAGPILGGALYNRLGVQTLIVLSGIAFFLSAVMEIFIRIPFRKRARRGHIVPALLRDLREGFSYLKGQSYILKAMVIAALLNLLLTPFFIVGAPVLLRVTMQGGETQVGLGLGLVQAGLIAGALLTGLFARWVGVRTLHRWLFLIAALFAPVAAAVTPFALGLGFYPGYWLFVGCAMLIAVVVAFLNIYVITAVQKRTPNENLGKVMAIVIAAAQCAAPLGQMLYGVLFEVFRDTAYIPALLVSVFVAGVAVFTRQILRGEKDL
jgi:MFS family permease